MGMIYKDEIHLETVDASKMVAIPFDVKIMPKHFSINFSMNPVEAHLVEQVIVVRSVIHSVIHLIRIHSHTNQALWILMRTFSELVSADSINHEIQIVRIEKGKGLNQSKKAKRLSMTFVRR